MTTVKKIGTINMIKTLNWWKITAILSTAALSAFPVLYAGNATRAARVSKAEIAEATTVIPVTRAVVALNPTKGNQAHGTVTFARVEGGVKVVATVDGLTPGKHGFHIHEYGDCSAPDASSAGGHFNPSHSDHGSPDSLKRHAGDLGNIVADEKGHAYYERTDQMIELDGPNTIVGRSVIVHANSDDYITQPTGNAGGRVACGVIIAR
jgi:Cu-Zn family superoxide dismutase